MRALERLASLSSLGAVLALAAAVPAALAQPCQGDVTLSTQTEVNAFACTEVTGRLTIDSVGPDEITSLAGLGNLTSVGSLAIISNPELTSLAGLESLTSVGGLRIWSNSALTSLTGLENLASVGEFLQISSNYMLSGLTGLDNLTSIDGNFSIQNLSSLRSLAGLDNLTSVGGFLDMRSNSALRSLAGLENLTSIGGYLGIESNIMLRDVDALASITSIGTFLIVENNTTLSRCTVGLAPLLLEGEIGGTPYFNNNAPGCNSYWEAIGGAVDTEDGATPLVTALAAPFPNPSAGTATLAFTLAESAEVTLTAYDALGRRVATLAAGMRPAGSHEATWGAGLPAGVYVVRLTVGAEAWTCKLPCFSVRS